MFGGLLWPIAWLWAFTKPIGYRMAYGTDKHEDYFDEMAEKHREGKLPREEACAPARGARGDGGARRAAAEAAGAEGRARACARRAQARAADATAAGAAKDKAA